jgi:6-pyruvoyltetrahydropterin/6-carboxytetrahydropterin synthase
MERPALADQYHVRIDKAEHVFSAAHFITFGDQCERLHGHNYHVAVEVTGPLDANHLVVDFLLLRAKLDAIVKTLDHYVLLPTRHEAMEVVDDGREVKVSLGDRRWLFPSGDCRLLAVANTTAELLAAHIGQQLIRSLGEVADGLERIRVEVDECDGQIGVWQR